MKTWIDFKGLRKKLDFEQVLRHYGVEVKRKGNQHQGFCPLPNHQGKKNSPSFSANLERGIFQCFGCGAKGNVLEFAAMMEKADPKDGAALHKVAGELQKRFCPELGTSTETKPPATKPEKAEPKSDLSAVVNAPLDFELKGLDRKHPYLLNRGFSQETIDHFDLGFCSRRPRETSRADEPKACPSSRWSQVDVPSPGAGCSRATPRNIRIPG
jgi:DNA primase